MPIFEVRDTEAKTLRNKENAFMVAAEDSASALRIAQAQHAISSSMSNAVVTEISEGTAMSVAGSMDGWRFSVAVSGEGKVEVTGGASDALDDVGSALVTALNSLAGISNALYTAASQTLRVAEGATDALGDRSVTVSILPPITSDDGGQVNEDVEQEASFVSSITHEGLSSADLEVVFVADTTITPAVRWGLTRQPGF